MARANSNTAWAARLTAAGHDILELPLIRYEALPVPTDVDPAGFDWILIETVGVGLSELEVVELADTTVLLLVPESGDSVQAMKAGAYDYLIKPFDAEELRLRTKNLIEQRRKLREKFRKEFRIKSLEETVRVPGYKLLHQRV